MILMIDNYDSFTYNLVQYLRELGAEVAVFRNDKICVSDIEHMRPSAIVISPGPGRPESAGVTLPLLKQLSGKIPILGVCLGHQAIAAAFGAEVVPARRLMHGKTSQVTCDGKTIYKGIRSPFQAMRYHSLAVSRQSLPPCLQIASEADDGEIMGIRHKTHPTEGIQFHPESIMTPVGKRLLRNFLNITGNWQKGTSLPV
ncbi:MAG: aminodeoxychorismate/anthranilate synthase component II [Deltaproteobacteria bacterium]|nr:aminodeoxychorismate/anthranilate synthase component II [Deltaproteobacteria bacterium]MBW1960001.1 aminodeoxychorismate/anthranilate synthase component II [Deltaproteobacteria bacterium]MBW1995500.1 aminodeoxychorismate/anthranilate synthase component II [Deltaproteobacteria bacterium]MBW2153604.1 aminodeoxychorismate/anthranilate synthase component II [Deltaproteobacteria bacterium]